jgi:alkanesulfonate monooxygenase SsuD/methylene tetrahydromethanopterin reductase-like flavin-dependent oxidoreductase (luciferase family)
MFPNRLTVAFGHGVEAWMLQVGARPRDRVVALEETVTTVRRLLAGEIVSVRGQHVRFDEVALDSPPEVVPPILVGTTGSKSIRAVARSADGLLFPEGSGPRFLREAHGQWRAAGSRPHRSAVYAWLGLEDSFEQARARIAGAVRDWLTNGLFEAAVGAARESAGADADEAGADLVREVAVCGTRVDCAAAIASLAAAGADEIVLAPVGPGVNRQVERFAAEVLAGHQGQTLAGTP